MLSVLSPSFLLQPTLQIARQLLGKRLVRRMNGNRISGRIVEVEAYLAENDLASHSNRGRTRSNQSMFLPAGYLYVYPIHAKYCMNVVTEKEGTGAAVLIRAMEPVEGISCMQLHAHHRPLIDLLRGPARSCQAFSIDRSWDGSPLIREAGVWLEDDLQYADSEITQGPRIGIRQSVELPYRFFLDGSRFVSGPRKWHRSKVPRPTNGSCGSKGSH